MSPSMGIMPDLFPFKAETDESFFALEEATLISYSAQKRRDDERKSDRLTCIDFFEESFNEAVDITIRMII